MAEDYGADEQGDYGAEEQGDYGAEEQQEYAEEQADYAEPEPEPEPEYKEPEPEPEPEYNYEEPQGADLDEDKSNVSAYCYNLYSDNPSFNWFTTKLIDEKMKKADLEVEATGKGGLPELINKMQGESTNIIFFLLRVNTYDDEQSSRAKFIYGRFVGSKVKFMMKARLTPNLGAIADNFQVKHLSKDCDEEMKGWTSEMLSKEFLRIGGAHKPSRYDYGGGDVYSVKKK